MPRFGQHVFNLRKWLTNIWLCRLRGVFSSKRPNYFGKYAFNVPTNRNLRFILKQFCPILNSFFKTEFRLNFFKINHRNPPLHRNLWVKMTAGSSNLVRKCLKELSCCPVLVSKMVKNLQHSWYFILFFILFYWYMIIFLYVCKVSSFLVKNYCVTLKKTNARSVFLMQLWTTKNTVSDYPNWIYNKNRCSFW